MPLPPTHLVPVGGVDLLACPFPPTPGALGGVDLLACPSPPHLVP